MEKLGYYELLVFYKQYTLGSNYPLDISNNYYSNFKFIASNGLTNILRTVKEVPLEDKKIKKIGITFLEAVEKFEKNNGNCHEVIKGCEN